MTILPNVTLSVTEVWRNTRWKEDVRKGSKAPSRWSWAVTLYKTVIPSWDTGGKSFESRCFCAGHRSKQGAWKGAHPQCTQQRLVLGQGQLAKTSHGRRVKRSMNVFSSCFLLTGTTQFSVLATKIVIIQFLPPKLVLDKPRNF